MALVVKVPMPPAVETPGTAATCWTVDGLSRLAAMLLRAVSEYTRPSAAGRSARRPARETRAFDNVLRNSTRKISNATATVSRPKRRRASSPTRLDAGQDLAAGTANRHLRALTRGAIRPVHGPDDALPQTTPCRGRAGALRVLTSPAAFGQDGDHDHPTYCRPRPRRAASAGTARPRTASRYPRCLRQLPTARRCAGARCAGHQDQRAIALAIAVSKECDGCIAAHAKAAARAGATEAEVAGCSASPSS